MSECIECEKECEQVCEECGDPICGACSEGIDGKPYCSECMEATHCPRCGAVVR